MVARRSIITSAVTAAGGLTLARILADPGLARAAAASLEMVTVDTAHGPVSAALALPEQSPAGAVLLIHEWWGLNDQIKAVAASLADEGYVALAVDLMAGQVTTVPEEAQAQMQAVDPEQALETLTAWIEWLRAHSATTDKVATMGWCFGGGWSLNASLAAPIDGTVIYYGRVIDDPAALGALQGPVLGHFADLDGFITSESVDAFEQALGEAGIPHELFRYDADHAFANPTSARYDNADADLAWQRSLGFLARVLG